MTFLLTDFDIILYFTRLDLNSNITLTNKFIKQVSYLTKTLWTIEIVKNKRKHKQETVELSEGRHYHFVYYSGN